MGAKAALLTQRYFGGFRGQYHEHPSHPTFTEPSGRGYHRRYSQGSGILGRLGELPPGNSAERRALEAGLSDLSSLLDSYRKLQ